MQSTLSQADVIAGGAKAILLYAGRDATEEFAMIHPPNAISKYAPDTGELVDLVQCTRAHVSHRESQGLSARPCLRDSEAFAREKKRKKRRARFVACTRVCSFLGLLCVYACLRDFGSHDVASDTRTPKLRSCGRRAGSRHLLLRFAAHRVTSAPTTPLSRRSLAGPPMK